MERKYDVDLLGVPRRENCLYASCYCEENIWQLCNAIRNTNQSALDPFRVVFISNSSKTIPLWCQNAGTKNKDGLVIWDYHVILLRLMDSICPECLIYDLGTTLTFPCCFDEYYDRAIKDDSDFRPSFRRKFRIIDASQYLTRFSSNRSHMKNVNGDWLRPPPPWPCIQPSDQPNNIHEFWSMQPVQYLSDISEILDIGQLRARYSNSNN